MEYTEKTSGAQIAQFMKTIMTGEDARFCDITYDNDNVGITRIHNIPSIGHINEALIKCGINPIFVTIDNMWGHLTMWFCNWDCSGIEEVNENGNN